MKKKNKRTSKRSAFRKINPVKAKLKSMSECFEQLQNGLPETQEAYINSERITHSYVKSCFLMIIQRAVDINNAIIEFKGQVPHQQKHHSFLTLHQNSAINKETLDFFMRALDCYENIINPYQELTPAELYDISCDMLTYGKVYTHQLENYFASFSPRQK